MVSVTSLSELDVIVESKGEDRTRLASSWSLTLTSILDYALIRAVMLGQMMGYVVVDVVLCGGWKLQR